MTHSCWENHIWHEMWAGVPRILICTVWTVHRPRTRFSHGHFVSVFVPACCHSCSGYSHMVTHWLHAHVWLKEHIVCVLPQNCHTSSRNVTRYTSLEHYTYTGHVHSFLIFETIFLTSTFQPASTLRRSTTSSFTGYEPKQLAEPLDHRHFTEDNQRAEHEDLRVKPLLFHRPSIASTYDSAESIVTPPPNSDLDDEQIRITIVPTGARRKCGTITSL